MSHTQPKASVADGLSRELYFLIIKFLSEGPCSAAAEVLKTEVERHQLLPKGINWLGEETPRSFQDTLVAEAVSTDSKSPRIFCWEMISGVYEKHVPKSSLLKCINSLLLLDTKSTPRRYAWHYGVNLHIGSGPPVAMIDQVKSAYTSHYLFEYTANGNPHIPNDFLQKICQHLLPILEKTIPPSVKGVSSLLGAGRQSLLRPPQDVGHLLSSDCLSVCRHGASIPPGYKTKNTFSLTNVTAARQTSGTTCKRNFLHHGIYSKMSMHRRILGHLSAVYCVLFDQTGHSIITGADDNLVKIWSSSDGRLLATLRGHNAEISDIAINCENTLIAAGSCDKTIRVWDIQTSAPVGVLQGHTGTITSLQFCPSCFGDLRYLMSTGGDATVSFWKYDFSTKQFDPTPVKFQEKSRPGAQIICSSFSPGGGFLVTGNTDHNIRIYQISPGPPERIAELNAHLDHVDSIQFSHSSERFLSGSRDGTARIWYFQRSEWKSHVLNNQQQLSSASSASDEETNKITKLRVTMVGWDLSDHFVITAVNDHTIKVWDSKTAKLIYVLKGHQDEVFVIEAHPTDPYLLLTAGHDGYIILWNLATGRMIKSFYNSLQGQGHGAVFDCKFSPDGLKFASTDSHGHLAIYGFGSSEPYQKVPEEQFFHTDYRPVMRDMNNHVLDEQTQTAPHLMPPPFLVDVDGNPHPVFYQRLIPGHSSNIRPRRQVTSPPPVPSSPLPPLLAEIERFERGGVLLNPELLHSPPPGNNAVPPLVSPGAGSRNRGLLQEGDIEGVRQLNVNIPIIQDATEADINAWRSRTIVPKLKNSAAKLDEERRVALGRQELLRYLREKKKRPLPSTSRPANPTANKAERRLRSRARRTNRREPSRPAAPRPAYNTRAAANNGSEMEESGEEDDVMVTPSDSEEDEAWNSNSSESSEYSDWTEEVGLSTRQQSENQRPSRRVRRVLSSSDEEGESSAQQPRQVKKETEKPKKTTKKKKKARRKPRLDQLDEWLDYHRPPEWMTSTKLRRSPYVPQVGDEVYYFKQGHEMYVNEVLAQDTYDINPKKQCFFKLDLKAEELCKVVSLHCVVGPPTLVSLKLAILNPDTGANTGGTFTVKYHDMADVLDFFVLKQYYDHSLERDWRPGTRFRSVIDDCWWSGVITEVSPYQVELPDSHFQCYVVSWDTGEIERMSPWDLEPFPDDDSSTPDETEANTSGVDSSNIPITDEEHDALVKYVPQDNDWPDEEYDAAIGRITRGLGIISELPFAGPFAYPVDVHSYPDYWSVVAYPVDLKAISDRLLNKYYRRKTALLWDVCQTGRNAKAYNEEDSEIVQNADKLVSILTRFIKDPSCLDPLTLCDDMANENTEVDIENVYESEAEGQTSEGPSRPNKRKNLSNSGPMRKKAKRSEEEEMEEYSFNEEILALLNMLATRSDSEPFREPVDQNEFPDYSEYVDEPMCFSTIRTRIDGDYYNEPDPFIRDVRLVFSNSRKYNTNPKSRIYSMTIRLSALFENKVDELLRNFYRHRSGGGRRTRLRARQPAPQPAADEPGPSGFLNLRRTVTPRVRPELVPRSSARTSNRRNNDGAGPSTSGASSRRHNDGFGMSSAGTSTRRSNATGSSTNGTESLRMRISLTRGSVVSTTGLDVVQGTSIGDSRSLGTSSSSRHRTGNDVPDEGTSQRTRTRSRTYRESVSRAGSTIHHNTSNTEAMSTSLNGSAPRYSTRSRVPLLRLNVEVNGVSDHDSEEDEEEESAESGEESSEASEVSSTQEQKRSKSSSGKAPVSKKGATKKTLQKGKRVSLRRISSVSSEEPAQNHARRVLRTRTSSRYEDSASESDDDRSVNDVLDISSRGRVRRKASRMLDYVN